MTARLGNGFGDGLLAGAGQEHVYDESLRDPEHLDVAHGQVLVDRAGPGVKLCRFGSKAMVA